MILPDTNLLFYAYDQRSREHVKAKAWLRGIFRGTRPVGIPWVVILAFTRLTTHPNLLEAPLSVVEAEAIVISWLELNQVRLLSPGPETIAHFFQLLEEAQMGGNLSTDAMIGAHALEWGGTVYTNDRDFGRFTQIRWENPLH